jgi:hypothetical protein
LAASGVPVGQRKNTSRQLFDGIFFAIGPIMQIYPREIFQKRNPSPDNPGHNSCQLENKTNFSRATTDYNVGPFYFPVLSKLWLPHRTQQGN